MNTEIQSTRLRLIQMDISDAPTLFSYWSDPEVTKYMNIEPFHNIEQATEMIQLLNDLANKRKASRYSIFLKNTNQLIGTCGFNYIDFDHSRAEIAYDLGKPFWGKGYATEAIIAVLNDGFNRLKLNRIEAKVEPANVPSIKVLKKLGFTLEGTLRQYEKSKGKFIDLHMFSLLSTD